MQSILTVRISAQEAQALDGLCATTGKSRSEVVRDALRAYSLRMSLRQSQTHLAPPARMSGWLVEDDILKGVS
jgi:metal-responsive CopG/Arc/MetJ family transcriptional regulator